VHPRHTQDRPAASSIPSETGEARPALHAHHRPMDARTKPPYLPRCADQPLSTLSAHRRTAGQQVLVV